MQRKYHGTSFAGYLILNQYVYEKIYSWGKRPFKLLFGIKTDKRKKDLP